MQLIELAQKNISVFICHFHLNVLSANISIKFPCHYFLQWKSLNGKILSTSQKHPSSTSNSIQFNQVLELTTQMLYDNKEKNFYKKQTLLAINLVSKSRPDQVKLVGRVNIDLALIANTTVSIYSEFAPYKLTYCSVNADVTLKVQMSGKELTDKHPNNLDKSSFNDFFMINTANSSSPEFGTKPSPKFSNSHSQNTFSTNKLRQSRSGNLQIRKGQRKDKQQFEKRQRQDRQKDIFSVEQTHTIARNYSTVQIGKKDDTSFRTIPQRRQPNFKNIANDSIDNHDHQHNTWTLRENHQNNFSDQIDLNKRKIADLQQKISDLSKNLQDSKTVALRRDVSAKDKEELMQKLAENQEKMREQFELLKQMKGSSSSNENNQNFDVQQVQIPRATKQLKRSGFEQLYTQKISQALQTQRIMQQNQYVIRQLQATRSQLQKKLSIQKNETEQLQLIWRQKREHYQEKIRSLQKQKRQGQFEIQQLIKYKYKVQEATQEKNNIKLEYKQLQHELMKTRFQLNDKILKNAEYLEKIQLKETDIDKSKNQIKELVTQKANFEKQLTQLLISNQKLHSLNQLKQQQVFKLQTKLYDSDKSINQLKYQLIEIRKGEEQKDKMEQKLIQYNVHMETLQLTIKKLQTQLQSCQYITKANQNLNRQLVRLQQRIAVQEKQLAQKDQQIQTKEQQIQTKEEHINALNSQIHTMDQQKQLLLQKNTSFCEQLQHIESLLQESYHKASKQSEQEIQQLKRQLKLSNQQYEQVIMQKTQLEQDIDSLIEQKEQTISQLQKQTANLRQTINSLTHSLQDKQNIINLKDIELQNRKSISDQLTLKLQAMESKQNQMQQTITVLQTESKQIFNIIQEKQLLDEELLQLRENTEQHLEIIKELEDLILQMKLQKEELLRHYYEQIQKRNEASNLSHQDSIIRKKLQQAQLELEQTNTKIYQLTDQLSAKQRYIHSLQTKNDSLLKKVIYFESLQQTTSINPYESQQIDNNTQLAQSHAIRERQMELRLQQQKNMHRFVNQISQLSQKIIQLQAIINDKSAGKLVYEGVSTERLSRQQQQKITNKRKSQHKDSNLQSVQQHDKSQQLTPLKNRLDDELALQSADKNHYILSDRKKPTSNRSNESYASFQYVNQYKQSPSLVKFSSQNQKNTKQQIPQQDQHNSPFIKSSQSDYQIKEKQTEQDKNKQQNIFFNSNNDSPQLKISQLRSLLQVKNLIIKDLENKCIDLAATVRQKDNQLAERTQPVFTGRIRPNSSRKHITNHNNQSQTHINCNHTIFQRIPSSSRKEQNSLNKRSRSRSRSASPTSKIASNRQTSEKEFIRMKNQVQLQETQIKRLKKNLRLMNLQLSTLSHLKRQHILGQTQIKINNTFSHLNCDTNNQMNNGQSKLSRNNGMDQSQSNLMMDTNYFNLTNAANPNEKSYLIRKVNNEEQTYDKRKSPKKPTLYDNIISKREKLQKKFNINSRLGIQPRVLTQKNTNKENFQSQIEQRIIQKLQNTAHFSNLNHLDENNEFTTTITQLTQRVNQLHQTLTILQEEKVFLENQLEIFQQEKFCLTSDLNAREIQIYELYKSIIALREQVRELKFQNQSYLKMISEHEANVNSIVKKASESYQHKINTQNYKQPDYDRQPSREPSKMVSISVSGIDFLNEQNQHHSAQQIQYDQMMRNQRDQERYSLLERIDKYEKRIEESLLTEKQKYILEEEIQSKQEIMIDQNEKLYLQQTIIKDLNSKVQLFERQIAKLQQIINTTSKVNNSSLVNNNSHHANNSRMNVNLQHLKSNQYKGYQICQIRGNLSQEKQPDQPNYSIILHENESLIKENANLKEQTIYLGNQIDRINHEFAQLNSLLYKRQDQITQLKFEFIQAKNQYETQILSQQQIISSLQHSLHAVQMQLQSNQSSVSSDNTHLNTINHLNTYPNSNLLAELQARMKDLSQQFLNLKSNLTSILQQNKLQQLNQSNKEFLVVLLESMQKTIVNTFNIVAQSNIPEPEPHSENLYIPQISLS